MWNGILIGYFGKEVYDINVFWLNKLERSLNWLEFYKYIMSYLGKLNEIFCVN